MNTSPPRSSSLIPKPLAKRGIRFVVVIVVATLDLDSDDLPSFAFFLSFLSPFLLPLFLSLPLDLDVAADSGAVGLPTFHGKSNGVGVGVSGEYFHFGG